MKASSITKKGFSTLTLAWMIVPLAVFCLVLTLAAGCGSGKEKSPDKKVEKAKEKQPEKTDSEEALSLEEIDRQRRAKALEYSFDRAGRRDPFQPIATVLADLLGEPGEEAAESDVIETPLQKKSLSELKLVATVTDVLNPRALVEDSSGLGYIIQLGTLIGDRKLQGRVTKIYDDSIDIQQMVGYRGEEKPVIKKIRLRPKEGEEK